METYNIFWSLDFVALIAEETNCMAQHARRQNCYRLFYNIFELLEKGFDIVVN